MNREIRAMIERGAREYAEKACEPLRQRIAAQDEVIQAMTANLLEMQKEVASLRSNAKENGGSKKPRNSTGPKVKTPAELRM